MALIKCPECENNISDKAEACIHCGFPLREYVEKQAEMIEEEIEEVVVETRLEFPQLPVLVAKFNKGYMITYDNGNIKITQDDNVLYDGNVCDIVIHGAKQSVFNYGRLELLVLKSKLPTELHCEDDVSFAICEQIVDDYELRMQDRREALEKRVQEKQEKKEEEEKLESLIRNNLACPKCHSQNIEVFDKEIYGAREAKIKTSYSMNVNPLHLFTVLNKKEKVVRPAYSGVKVTRYKCNDCHEIWTKKEY